MSARLLLGDVRQRIKEIPDGSVDFLCTSPPFLALRKYGDNPEGEMGSEATPAEFIDALLSLTAEFRRVLAPHGSIAVELGDTFSGSGGAGGDYNADGLRAGQAKFDGSAKRRTRTNNLYTSGYSGGRHGNETKKPGEMAYNGGRGWPLAKSLCLTPFAYPMALAYGRNPLTGQPSPAGQWMVRNMIAWARPNPPVGDLADKVRPGTSYITVATTSPRRWFDLDAVRTAPARDYTGERHGGTREFDRRGDKARKGTEWASMVDPAGAPPLDWWDDDYDPADPVDAYTLGHMTVVQATQPYKGAHYATWPKALAQRLILMMCPPKVCTVCGVPSERITGMLREQRDLATHLRECRRVSGLSMKDVNSWFPGSASNWAGHWEDTTSQPMLPRWDQWLVLKDRLGASSEFDWLIDKRTAVEYSANGTLLHRSERRTVFGRGGEPESGNRIRASRHAPDLWTDCGHDAWRQGCVLDPFAGSGTTLAVATGCGRDAIGIELYEHNAHLIRERVGMFLEEVA